MQTWVMFLRLFFDSNDAFENACMEFDEVNLKPTYKILWGVPGFHLDNTMLHVLNIIILHVAHESEIHVTGRSNAINISERLGLPSTVVEKARELYGAASAEIDEVSPNSCDTCLLPTYMP